MPAEDVVLLPVLRVLVGTDAGAELQIRRGDVVLTQRLTPRQLLWLATECTRLAESALAKDDR